MKDTPEQAARDLLEEIGIQNAELLTPNQVLSLVNLIKVHQKLEVDLAEARALNAEFKRQNDELIKNLEDYKRIRSLLHGAQADNQVLEDLNSQLLKEKEWRSPDELPEDQQLILFLYSPYGLGQVLAAGEYSDGAWYEHLRGDTYFDIEKSQILGWMPQPEKP